MNKFVGIDVSCLCARILNCNLATISIGWLDGCRDNYLPPERTDQFTSDWRISLSPTAD
jgi:hypothetical protein